MSQCCLHSLGLGSASKCLKDGSCPICSYPHCEVDGSSQATCGHQRGLEVHLKIEVATYCSRRACPSLDCVPAMVIVLGLCPLCPHSGCCWGPTVALAPLPPGPGLRLVWPLGVSGSGWCEGLYPGVEQASAGRREVRPSLPFPPSSLPVHVERGPGPEVRLGLQGSWPGASLVPSLCSQAACRGYHVGGGL